MEGLQGADMFPEASLYLTAFLGLLLGMTACILLGRRGWRNAVGLIFLACSVMAFASAVCGSVWNVVVGGAKAQAQVEAIR